MDPLTRTQLLLLVETTEEAIDRLIEDSLYKESAWDRIPDLAALYEVHMEVKGRYQKAVVDEGRLS